MLDSTESVSSRIQLLFVPAQVRHVEASGKHGRTFAADYRDDKRN